MHRVHAAATEGNKDIFVARIVITVELFNINQPLVKQEGQFRGEFCHIDLRDSTKPNHPALPGNFSFNKLAKASQINTLLSRLLSVLQIFAAYIKYSKSIKGETTGSQFSLAGSKQQPSHTLKRTLKVTDCNGAGFRYETF